MNPAPNTIGFRDIYKMNQDELTIEVKRAEMLVRELYRLLRKRQKEDVEHFKMDAAGNAKRFK